LVIVSLAVGPYLQIVQANSKSAMMKTIPLLFCLLIVNIFVSCKKDPVQVSSLSNFGFTANSVNYKWDFVPAPSYDLTDAFFRKTISANTNDTMYVLVGVYQPSNIELQFAIHTSQLRPSTYTTITRMSDPWVESTCFLDGELYGARSDDPVTVTITSVDRNYASGNFTAVMHDLQRWGGLHELRIWNGYFNRVAITD
jgi:hypothetical protein